MKKQVKKTATKKAPKRQARPRKVVDASVTVPLGDELSAYKGEVKRLLQENAELVELRDAATDAQRTSSNELARAQSIASDELRLYEATTAQMRTHSAVQSCRTELIAAVERDENARLLEAQKRRRLAHNYNLYAGRIPVITIQLNLP